MSLATHVSSGTRASVRRRSGFVHVGISPSNPAARHRPEQTEGAGALTLLNSRLAISAARSGVWWRLNSGAEDGIYGNHVEKALAIMAQSFGTLILRHVGHPIW